MKPAAVAALVASLIAGVVLWPRAGSVPEPASDHTVAIATTQESSTNYSPASAKTAPTLAPAENAASPVPAGAAKARTTERAPMSDAERHSEELRFDRGERRVYDDVAATLGLSATENDALISVLREQHLLYYELMRSGHGADIEAVHAWEQGRREAVDALLGTGRSLALADYESTLGGRHAVLDVVVTLEREGIPMSSQQRSSLTKAVIEQHAYPPPLQFAGNSTGANMQIATAEMRLAGQKLLGIAQGILTTRQYDAYQEWLAFIQEAQEAANNSAVERQPPEKR